MSHLGQRVTALLDGELPADVAARAHAHLAGCATCREELEAERAVRTLLRSAQDPAVPAALTAVLHGMGGPAGPLPPRPGHLPGAPRPEPLALPRRAAPRGVRRPAGVSGPTRPPRAGRRTRRRTSRRLAVALLGSVSLASLGVFSVIALSGLLLSEQAPVGPATSQLTVDRLGSRPPVIPAVGRTPAATSASASATVPRTTASVAASSAAGDR